MTGRLGRRFLRSPLACLGALLVAALVLTAVLAPRLAGDPLAQNLTERLEPPSPLHWFGTDDLGRDVFARVIHGTRVSLAVGAVAMSVALALGLLVGLLSGYFGRWVDMLLMRTVDVLLCFPSIFLILMVIAFLEPNIKYVMLVIGLTSWMGLSRLVRAETLSVREREYIWAARAMNLSTPRILLAHILPNVISPVMVWAALSVGAAILVESALSFLGLGVQPPTPSWGNMLTAGKDYVYMAWWLSLYPGLAIFFTVLAFNLLGEGLRDVLDPRSDR